MIDFFFILTDEKNRTAEELCTVKCLLILFRNVLDKLIYNLRPVYLKIPLICKQKNGEMITVYFQRTKSNFVLRGSRTILDKFSLIAEVFPLMLFLFIYVQINGFVFSCLLFISFLNFLFCIVGKHYLDQILVAEKQNSRQIGRQ